MSKIVYLPLEPYEERYTLQLMDWTLSRFRQRDLPYYVIEGRKLGSAIETGLVLDAYGRNYYALTQMAELVWHMKLGDVTPRDIIYIQDMYHPGWEALPYIKALCPQFKDLKIYTFCFAQSVDINDFTYPMRHWMRHFEMVVDRTADGIFVASTCLAQMLRAAMFDAPIHIVGLPFDMDEVRKRMPIKWPLKRRTKRIVYTSRWDEEKQPWFFMDLVEQATHMPVLQDYEHAVCTGAKQLRSNNPAYVERARQMEAAGLLKIYEGLAKNEYYKILADSRVQFNCALQDFVSNTLNEASALGTPSLLPAYLSFPEAVGNNERHLYVPWSLENALKKLLSLVMGPSHDSISYSAEKQHQTLDHIIDVLLGTDKGRYRYD